MAAASVHEVLLHGRSSRRETSRMMEQNILNPDAAVEVGATFVTTRKGCALLRRTTTATSVKIRR